MADARHTQAVAAGSLDRLAEPGALARLAPAPCNVLDGVHPVGAQVPFLRSPLLAPGPETMPEVGDEARLSLRVELL